MTAWLVSPELSVAILGLVTLYAAFVITLVVLGRGAQARAWAGFVPDCVILTGRLFKDPATPRTSKLLLLGLAGYLAMPIDLVPDFLPIVGQLDDALLVALVLRRVLRHADEGALARHWPGPAESLVVIRRLTKEPSRLVEPR